MGESGKVKCYRSVETGLCTLEIWHNPPQLPDSTVIVHHIYGVDKNVNNILLNFKLSDHGHYQLTISSLVARFLLYQPP